MLIDVDKVKPPVTAFKVNRPFFYLISDLFK